MKINKSYLPLLAKAIKVSAFVWFLSIFVFMTTIAHATRGFIGVVQDTEFGNSQLFLFLLLGSIGVGVLAFAVLILTVLIRVIVGIKANEFSHSFSFARLSPIIAIVLLLASIGFLYGKNQESQRKYEEQNLITTSDLANIAAPEVSQAPIPTLKPKPILKPKPTDNTPWGVAKQIDEVTWTTKIGEDNRMGAPQEIFEALNVYRSTRGSGRLEWDNNLAVFAQSRAEHFKSIGNIDKHAGFKEYTSNPDNLKQLGFWGVGENSCFGYKALGVHIIEWIFAGDKPHDDNQLDKSWTHVGIGVAGLGVDLIFGKFKM